MRAKRVAIAALAAALCAPIVFGQNAADEIEKYRAGAAGRQSGRAVGSARRRRCGSSRAGRRRSRSSSATSGSGPGVVKGAYAQMPRYFADADRVMDLETRLV